MYATAKEQDQALLRASFFGKPVSQVLKQKKKKKNRNSIPSNVTQKWHP